MAMREIRLTVRSLARTPLYTLTAIASLALGIGATTAIFSMMDRVLLRTLPVKEPERLAFLYHFLPSVPFGCLAIAIVLTRLAQWRSGRSEVRSYPAPDGSTV